MLQRVSIIAEQLLKQVAKNRLLTAALSGSLMLTFAAANQLESPRWQLWQSTQLKGYARELAPKVNREKIAAEQLGKYNNHSMLVSHREGDGQVEIHEKQADVFIVQSGEGTIVLGGEMIDGKMTTPGEVRGTSIKGGDKRKLVAGDIVHISAGVPHQFLVESGKELTCVFVKVEETK